MPNLTLHDRPQLLMLSDCLPRQTDAASASSNYRAWQLLSLACRTHDVFLAAVADGPVNLHDWRAAKAVATQIVLVPSRGRLLRWVGARRSDALANATEQWSQQHAFDMVLLTTHRLLDLAQPVEGAWRIVDAASLQESADQPRFILPRLRRRRKITQQSSLEQQCIQLSDGWIAPSSHRPLTCQGRLHPRLTLDATDDVSTIDTLAHLISRDLVLPAPDTSVVARAA